MAWYDSAVFYHIYPLGLCGCPHENNGEEGHHFDKLTQWADHARKLGFTAIYIGPLFESGSHGYDTIDYRRVDRRLGTNDEFKTWVKHCHENGQHVIVDGVFNHTGRGFFAFQDLLKNRENSQYKDWYCNVNFWGNNEYNDGFSYDNWGGFNLLVKLNVWNQAVKDYHFDTVRYWIHEFDIDGIRLDAADVLDMGFMHDLRGVCSAEKQDFWLMGEVIHGDYSRWTGDGMLNSVTNYDLHKGLYSGHNSHNYFEIAHTVRRLNGLCGDTKLYTFADNHDVARIHTKLQNKEHIYPLSILVYTLPGIPSVYYGSEYGIDGDKQQGSDWNLRPCLELSDFNDQDPLPSLIRKLGKIKEDFPEVSCGDYRELMLTNRQFGFARCKDGRAVVTLVNNDDNPAHIEVNLPVDANRAVNLLTIPDETEEEKAERLRRAAEELKAHEARIRSELSTLAGQLKDAAGSIVKAADDTKNMVDTHEINEDYYTDLQNRLPEIENAEKNMAKLREEFAEKLGVKNEPSADEEAARACETLEIRDGRLIVDLAPNRGVVAYLTKE